MSVNMSTDIDAEQMAKAFYETHLGFGVGAQFMAVLFDTLFAGVLICQLTHWLPNMKHDGLHIRIIAGFGALAAIATTIFTWQNYMSTFVYHFGSYARFASMQELGWYPILDMFTVVPVQLIFAERSIKLNNMSWMVILADGVLILGTAGAALGSTIVTRGHTMFDATENMRILLLIWPAICTCTHLTLTSTIIFGLWKYRVGLTHSTSVVDRLIYTSLESQLPSTCFAFAAMMTLAVNPKSPIVPWIIIVHPKIFIVGCMAMLNSRHTWQRQGKLPSSGRYSSSSYRGGKCSNGTTGSSNESVPPGTPDNNLLSLSLHREDSNITGKTDLEGMGEIQTARLGLRYTAEDDASVSDPTRRPSFERADSDYRV